MPSGWCTVQRREHRINCVNPDADVTTAGTSRALVLKTSEPRTASHSLSINLPPQHARLYQVLIKFRDRPNTVVGGGRKKSAGNSQHVGYESRHWEKFLHAHKLNKDQQIKSSLFGESERQSGSIDWENLLGINEIVISAVLPSPARSPEPRISPGGSDVWLPAHGTMCQSPGAQNGWSVIIRAGQKKFLDCRVCSFSVPPLPPAVSFSVHRSKAPSEILLIHQRKFIRQRFMNYLRLHVCLVNLVVKNLRGNVALIVLSLKGFELKQPLTK